MHDAVKVFLLVVSGLFPIVDPLGGGPIFLGLTRDISSSVRRQLSWHVTLHSFVLMAGSYFLGSHILKFFGVSLPAVQIAGGLVVCAFGWTLLMNKDGDRASGPEALEPEKLFRQAFYPLTLPLTIGPGSISVAVTLGANATHSYGFRVYVIVAALLAMAFIAVTIFLCYAFTDWLVRILGETGTMVVIRLSAFLLLCIGVQIVCNGVHALPGSVAGAFQ